METPAAGCFPPVFLGEVLDDPALVRELVERNAPYWPVQRYFQSDAEYQASAGSEARGRPMFVAPVFRGDWAYDEPLVEGILPLLHHEGFTKAASQVFGSDRVRPQIVFANLTWQLPFDQGGGHTDVPAFRGIDRTRYPVWLLKAMGDSRLFEEERIRIATAVAWFYEGEDGGFTCWPDGPAAPPKVHEGDIYNTAYVGDNDRMFHRVRSVGEREFGILPDLTLESQLASEDGERWFIEDGGRVQAELSYPELRISISWKAVVFRDAEEERLVDEHSADLTLEGVLARFGADLDAREVAFETPSDPLRDADFVQLLSRVYGREPTCFD